MGWQDFLVDRFGKSPSTTETGSLQVYSSNPALLVSSRTYANPAEATPPAGIGTFGQYLGGLSPESFVPYFGRAVVPLLRNDAAAALREAALAEGARDFNYDPLGDAATPARLRDAVATLPVMAPQRLVWLPGVEERRAAGRQWIVPSERNAQLFAQI